MTKRIILELSKHVYEYLITVCLQMSTPSSPACVGGQGSNRNLSRATKVILQIAVVQFLEIVS